jgi:hypothetical protein
MRQSTSVWHPSNLNSSWEAVSRSWHAWRPFTPNLLQSCSKLLTCNSYRCPGSPGSRKRAASASSWLGSLDSPDSVWTIFALSEDLD